MNPTSKLAVVQLMRGETWWCSLKPIPFITMVTTLMAVPAWTATQPDLSLAGYYLVAADLFAPPGQSPHLTSGDRYIYPETAVPTTVVGRDDPLRTVAFGTPIRFRYVGLQPNAKYKLRVTYLSDSDARVQRLSADGVVLQNQLHLPRAKLLTCVVDLPPETYSDNKVELEFDRIAGPNAVVAEIQLWSTEKTLLPFLDITAGGDLRGAITGTIRDGDGAAVPGAQIQIGAGGTPDVLNAATDAQGRFAVKVPVAWTRNPDSLLTVTARTSHAVRRVAFSVRDAFLALPRLTPVPVAVTGVNTNALSLNGTWRFNPAPPDGFWKGGDAQNGWSHIAVPGEWTMQGFTVAKDVVAGYRRTFVVPADWAGKRIKLRCDAVYSEATVWINGVPVGGHLGGFTPFELDVTDAVRPGRENTIALAVKNESLADTLSSGMRYAAHSLGGITRNIRLFTVPDVNIASLHVTTTFDRQYHNATLHASVDVTNESTTAISGGRLEFTLIGPHGKGVRLSPDSLVVPPIAAGEIVSRTVDLPVSAPLHWDPEHPNLYVLSCRLAVDGNYLQTTQRRFGFRQIEMRGNQVFVNGRPVKLHGVCRHETDPLRGRSLTPDRWREDAELFRDANINFVRTSHYPPAEEFLDACDEMGIFVEDEAPICWAGGDSPDLCAATVRQTIEMVQRDRSHPCVLIWSLANESRWGANFARSAELVHVADPTRLRIFSYGQVDIASWHYPGPDDPDRAAKADIPTLFDEYCHLECYNRTELAADPGVRDEWGRGFAAMWEKMLRSHGCLGGSIWAGIDDVFRLPGGTSVGYGEWGLLDGWRRTRPEYWHVKKTYSPVRLLDRTVPVPSPGKPIVLRVENRHDFTNLSEIGIKWSLGDESGTVHTDVPPHHTGTIVIRPKMADVSGKRLMIRFSSPRGFMIDEDAVAIGSVPPAAVPGKPATAGEVRLSQMPQTITIDAGKSHWVIDRATGQIRSGALGDRTVVIGGPVLMLLPLATPMGGTTYRADIPPFNPTCSDWHAERVEAKQTADGAEVVVEGTYKEASGSYTLRFDSSGRLSIHYRFTCRIALNPRQTGIVFDVAKDCDTLSWQRRTQWSVYPDDHIDRPFGHARAFRGSEWPKVGSRTPPPWPWSLDSNAMGTNDFRATRDNIDWASLTATDGYGFLVRSAGNQSTRAWVDGDRLCLLIAGISTGGSDTFFGRHLQSERRPLHPGDVVEDTVTTELVK